MLIQSSFRSSLAAVLLVCSVRQGSVSDEVFEQRLAQNLDNTLVKLYLGDVDGANFVANSPDLTPEQLRRFAMDEDPGIRLEVAMHSNTTADVLQLLSVKTEHKDVKRAVLTHPNTTDETIIGMIDAEDVKFALRLARAKGWSHAVAERLARDRRTSVRRTAAGNPDMYPDLLALLAHDSYAHTAQAVADNDNTTEETLRELATSLNDNVRYSVSKSAKLTADMLGQFTFDDSSTVQISLLQRKDLPYWFIRLLAISEFSGVRDFASAKLL